MYCDIGPMMYPQWANVCPSDKPMLGQCIYDDTGPVTISVLVCHWLGVGPVATS